MSAPHPRPTPSLGDTLLTRLATGPLGRVAAFVSDLAVFWWGWARGRVRRALGR